MKRNTILPGQAKSTPKPQKAKVPVGKSVGKNVARGAKNPKLKPYEVLSKIAIDALEDAKAEDIVQLVLDGKTAMADEMIVASGRSNIHVSSVADKVCETLKENGYKDLQVEGRQHCDWVLIDAGNVIIHVFRPEVRVFYNLEKLWSPDAPDA